MQSQFFVIPQTLINLNTKRNNKTLAALLKKTCHLLLIAL